MNPPRRDIRRFHLLLLGFGLQGRGSIDSAKVITSVLISYLKKKKASGRGATAPMKASV